MTDDGWRTARAVVELRVWENPSLEQQAAVFARALDLLPRSRSPQSWATLVCGLAAEIYADMCPEFERARLRAAEEGSRLSLVPFRGVFAWRRRARFAGFIN
jgi:hypothetical protein